MIELTDNEENHEKAVPVKDNENRRTLGASLEPAYPNFAKDILTCSHVVLEFSPLNLMKSGTRQLGDREIESKN